MSRFAFLATREGEHLAETLAGASRKRGLTVVSASSSLADVVFVAADVMNHDNDAHVAPLMDQAYGALSDPAWGCVVVVSQVRPGWTRPWAQKWRNVYYQVDTIIMKQALHRMMHPEQIVVGCLDPDAPLPLPYQEYLCAFDAPVLQMSLESAEFAKCAINYCLAAQVETTNRLSAAALAAGADWEQVVAVLRNDARIGKYAYLRPGKANTHLMRDVTTIERLLRNANLSAEVTSKNKA